MQMQNTISPTPIAGCCHLANLMAYSHSHSHRPCMVKIHNGSCNCFQKCCLQTSCYNHNSYKQYNRCYE